MGRAVGIDLGTTNSVIAAIEGGQPQVIPNAEGNRTTPSVVAFLENGERLVGQMARRQAILNPKGTISSAKRFIGRKYDEVSSELTTVSFDVVPGPDGVVRLPSALGMTCGWPPSMAAITEFVVPRSMPTALPMTTPFRRKLTTAMLLGTGTACIP